MTVALDLTRRHFHRTLGDLTLIGSWVLNEDERWRPCLAIIRTGDERCEHTVPCVVTLDKAWIWSQEVGDMLQCADTVAGFLHCLRMNPTKRNIIRIASMVEDHLDDLLNIPPWEPIEREVLAEITITDEYGKQREVELTHDV